MEEGRGRKGGRKEGMREGSNQVKNEAKSPRSNDAEFGRKSIKQKHPRERSFTHDIYRKRYHGYHNQPCRLKKIVAMMEILDC